MIKKSHRISKIWLRYKLFIYPIALLIVIYFNLKMINDSIYESCFPISYFLPQPNWLTILSCGVVATVVTEEPSRHFILQIVAGVLLSIIFYITTSISPDNILHWIGAVFLAAFIIYLLRNTNKIVKTLICFFSIGIHILRSRNCNTNRINYLIRLIEQPFQYLLLYGLISTQF